MAYKIDVEACVGCGACEGSCPVAAIEPENDKYAIDSVKCTDCGSCEASCPASAISQA
ncbi:MAG: 4Fe-4S binding protein [Endomicrobium sp.]|jgi:ferredoxin|nr:4Fe-4S binding protein [Endomicrobium sp.]